MHNDTIDHDNTPIPQIIDLRARMEENESKQQSEQAGDSAPEHVGLDPFILD